jgi:hypothetical protein
MKKIEKLMVKLINLCRGGVQTMSECGCKIHDCVWWLVRVTFRIDGQTGLPNGTCPFCKRDMSWGRLRHAFDSDKRTSERFRARLLEIDPDFDTLDCSWSKSGRLMKLPCFIYDWELCARYGLEIDDLVNHRYQSGCTKLHLIQYSCAMTPELERLLPDDAEWCMQAPSHLGEISSGWEQHADGNTRLAVVAVLAALKRLKVSRDNRWLIGRAVYDLRFHYKWTVGPWRTYPYVWQPGR